MPAEITIIRHGQCTGNAADRASIKGNHGLFVPELRKQKSIDWLLTATGIKESQMTGEWIRNNIATEFDLYFTSNYVRAVDTAVHLDFNGSNWNRDILLGERKWGGIENLPYPERNAIFRKCNIPETENSMEWRPPNGESMREVLKRVKLFLEKVRMSASKKRLLIVSHGAPLQAFRILQHHIDSSQYVNFINGNNYIRNCHIFHYFDKTDEKSSIPMYSFEKSVFLDPSGKWVEKTQKIR